MLESLAAQTCRDFEVLIVEDGSTEPCDGVCARYPFVKYCYKENEGRSIARNRGMELASGDYFLFFDSFRYGRFIGHLQRVRHVACETHIHNGRFHSLVLHPRCSTAYPIPP